jgi:F-type H+-transporting ATPase subunit delta
MKITALQYARTLNDLTKDKSQGEVDAVVAEFVKLIAGKNQMRMMPQIIGRYHEIFNKENGIVEAEIISARELEKDQIVKLDNYLKGKYDAKEILINNIVNESIKGGIIIHVDDEVLDGSLERSLSDLKNILVI